MVDGRFTSRELVGFCEAAVAELRGAPDLPALAKTARHVGLVDLRMRRSSVVDPDQFECLQPFADTIWLPLAKAVDAVRPPLQMLARIVSFFSDALQRPAVVFTRGTLDQAVNGAWQQKALLVRSLRRLDVDHPGIEHRCRVALLSRPTITQRFEVQLILTLMHASPIPPLLTEAQFAQVLVNIDPRLLERINSATVMRALMGFDRSRLLEAMSVPVLRTLHRMDLVRMPSKDEDGPNGRMTINAFFQSGMERRVSAALYAACGADSSDSLRKFRRSIMSQVDCFPFSVDFVLDWRHVMET
ncbi:hypothetical protein FOZ63_033285 [Perkinsus olseni]|uniref:Uncharacterized protein n=1 Tax=Perkinsus olseni TaxID=32597 RepID=A0A7J6T9D0_PEROL|nr:hypothetical protein FOZ63_033285 [Perkinsus olseni]